MIDRARQPDTVNRRPGARDGLGHRRKPVDRSPWSIRCGAREGCGWPERPRTRQGHAWTPLGGRRT
jgi:hypothetical protein